MAPLIESTLTALLCPCQFVVVYTVASALFGRYVDKVFRADGNIQRALLNLGCVQYTILAVIIFSASLIPKGALSLNPPLLEEVANPPNDAESLGDDVETLSKRAASNTDFGDRISDKEGVDLAARHAKS